MWLTSFPEQNYLMVFEFRRWAVWYLKGGKHVTLNSRSCSESSEPAALPLLLPRVSCDCSNVFRLVAQYSLLCGPDKAFGDRQLST